MKVCFSAIAAIIVVLQAVYLDTATGQKEDKVIVNGKQKPTTEQLKTIWAKAEEVKNRKNTTFNYPTLFRLSFHQCVGTSCNGCVDPAEKENKGFEDIVDYLKQLHQLPEVYPYMTMSDLIPFILIKFLNHAILENNLECFQCQGCSMPTPVWRYWWGRPDGCKDILTKVEGSTPNGFASLKMSWKQMFDFFQNDFKFNPAEGMLLIGGGHGAAGNAHANVSGYDGFFNREHGKGFSNRVFKWSTGTTEKEWVYVANRPDSETDKFFQINVHNSEGAKVGLLCDTDILMYKIKRDPSKDLQCKINDNVYSKERKPYPYPFCEKSELYDLAVEYARDHMKFINEFFDLYNRMLAKGNEGKLHELKVPYLKPRRSMTYFRFIRVNGAECYRGAAKDLIENLKERVAGYQREYASLWEEAKMTMEIVKEVNSEEAAKALNDAKIAKENGDKLMETIPPAVENATAILSQENLSRKKRKEGNAFAETANTNGKAAIKAANKEAKKILEILEGLTSWA